MACFLQTHLIILLVTIDNMEEEEGFGGDVFRFYNFPRFLLD
jgi:hypothetical protein